MKQVNNNFYRTEDILRLSPIYENSNLFWFDVTIRYYKVWWFGILIPRLRYESVKSEVFVRDCSGMEENNRENVIRKFENIYRSLL